MHTHLARFVLLYAFLAAPGFGQATQKVMLKQKGVIELSAIHKLADYATNSLERDFGSEAFGTRIDPNLKSCAIRYKAWNLHGALAYSASFHWELNPDELRGMNRTIRFRDISKYPDLVLLYYSVRPVGVSFELQLRLIAQNSPNDSAGTPAVYARVTEDDLIFFGSRSPDNYVVPTVLSTWKHGISEQALGNLRFTDRDPSSEERLRGNVAQAIAVQQVVLGSTTSGVAFAKPVVLLQVRWPDETIDAIGELYDRREMEASNPGASTNSKQQESTARERIAEMVEAVTTFEKQAAVAAESRRKARETTFAEREAAAKRAFADQPSREAPVASRAPPKAAPAPVRAPSRPTPGGSVSIVRTQQADLNSHVVRRCIVVAVPQEYHTVMSLGRAITSAPDHNREIWAKTGESSHNPTIESLKAALCEHFSAELKGREGLASAVEMIAAGDKEFVERFKEAKTWDSCLVIAVVNAHVGETKRFQPGSLLSSVKPDPRIPVPVFGELRLLLQLWDVQGNKLLATDEIETTAEAQVDMLARLVAREWIATALSPDGRLFTK